MIDLAVPRDIEPSVRDCPGIALYDMDDLQRAVARNLDAREAEAEEALVLVREEVERFESWIASLDVVPTISALRQRADEVVRQVLDENEPRWESLSEADRERVEVMARAVVSRLLHEPTVRLKDARLLPLPAHAARAVRARPRPGGGAARRRGHAPGRAPPPGVIRAGHARQRAGAGAGALGRGAAGGRGRAGHDHHLRRPRRARGQVALRQGDRGGAARRATWTWRCTRPRTCRASCPPASSIVGVPERADPYDALCGAARSTSCARARWWAPPACGAAPSCSRCATTSRCASCAATSTPA